jgi:hypothetical protein
LGWTIPVVREALVELNPGQQALMIWVFVADITDVFILVLDTLPAYDASVNVGRHVLRLGQEEFPVREAPTASVLKRSKPTESHRNKRPVCWQYGGTGHLWRERLGRRDQGNESTNGGSTGCTGRKGGRPAA